MQRGIRAALPLVPPTFAIGVSFGVLAAPVMGSVAAIVMSAIVFAGSAQFAALSVLGAGGTAAAAVGAGLLLNARFLPMGIAAAPATRGGRLRRAAEGQTVVDASWALAADEQGRFDREILIGGAVPQFAGWVGGTIVGALAGSAIGNPETLGLDAMFPAFYLSLLAGELRSGDARLAAAIAAAIALVLIPFVPPGVPVLAAGLAALTGVLRRRRVAA
ncbi:MAG TPA: AzlC family ABC transporter permease [Solirubrobacteraceae bacterium]|jgi:predicted branched-subunit amino acid permease|nr:AzlC family ABC transporter permease [Solirubrobacteraceae bacterium]